LKRPIRTNYSTTNPAR